jgi:hypothetical protein
MIIREPADRKEVRHWVKKNLSKVLGFVTIWLNTTSPWNHDSRSAVQEIIRLLTKPTAYRCLSIITLLNLILIHLNPFNPAYLMSLRHITILILSNPIFLPPVYFSALIYFGRERGWWITCNYPTVLKEKNRNRNSTTCAIFDVLLTVYHYVSL